MTGQSTLQEAIKANADRACGCIVKTETTVSCSCGDNCQCGSDCQCTKCSRKK
jgi:hypothetical protein